MKLDLVTVLATLNLLLRQVSGSLPKINHGAGSLLQREGMNGTGVGTNGLAKAGA